MAGPRPQDDYNPNNSVAPTGAPSNDYLNVRANPQEFGAQVGQQTQVLGKTLENSGNDLMQVAIQTQGLANEHAATMAELQLATDGGEIYNKYRSLEGLDATNAKPQAIQNYLAVNQKIRESLGNPAAQRAYDQLATRRMSYVIQDMNSYAAEQQKKAYRDGNLASMNNAIESGASYTVASNPNQLADAEANVLFQTNAMFTAPTYGKYRNVGVVQEKNGSLKFDDSDEGRVAQADYDNYKNIAIGKLYDYSFKAILSDLDRGGPKAAKAFLDQYKDKIPQPKQAELYHSLTAPLRQEEARQLADDQLSGVDQSYNNAITQPPGEIQMADKLKQIAPGLTITSQARTPEHNAAVGGVPDSQHISGTATDVVLPPGMTFDQFKDNLKTHGIQTSELLNEGDHVHIAWGQKGVEGKGAGYVTPADYYRLNYTDIVQNARKQAQETHPGDQVFEDAVAQRTEQRISDVIRQQELKTRAYQDKIVDFVHPSNGPVVTDMNQIINGPPEIRQAWENWTANDAYADIKLQRLITANSHGQAQGFGTRFLELYQKAARGQIGNPNDLMSYVGTGKDAELTNTGFASLSRIIKDGQTPEGRSIQQAQAAFFEKLHSDKVGIGNVHGDDMFTQFLMRVLPQLQGARTRGESMGKYLDPKSSEYVGKELDAIYPADKRLADYQKLIENRIPIGQLISGLGRPNATLAPNASAPTTYNSPEDVGRAYQAGKITKDQARQIISQRFGGFAPSVPKPTD